jgi:hypothetical protein
VARETHKGPNALIVGSFLVSLLALAVNIAGNKLSGPYLWAPIAALGFVSLLWGAPRIWRYTSMAWSRSTRLRRLHAEWPGFQVHVATLRDFYHPSRPGSINDLFQNKTVPSFAVIEAEASGFAARIDAAQRLVTLMDRLTSYLATDAHWKPRSVHSARRIVRDFELLSKVFEFQGVAAALRLMRPSPSYPDALPEFFRAYEQFRRDYLAFARETNRRVDDQLFEGE